MKGDKQYNMIESDDYLDPALKIPVFSLYGKSRRPTPEMLAHCDGLLVDHQIGSPSFARAGQRRALTPMLRAARGAVAMVERLP